MVVGAIREDWRMERETLAVKSCKGGKSTAQVHVPLVQSRRFAQAGEAALGERERKGKGKQAEEWKIQESMAGMELKKCEDAGEGRRRTGRQERLKARGRPRQVRREGNGAREDGRCFFFISKLLFGGRLLACTVGWAHAEEPGGRKEPVR